MRTLFALVLALTATACVTTGGSIPDQDSREVLVQVRNTSGGPVALHLEGTVARVATIDPGTSCVSFKIPDGVDHYRIGLKHLAERVVYSEYHANFGEIRYWALSVRNSNMMVHDLNSLRPSSACVADQIRDIKLGIMKSH